MRPHLLIDVIIPAYNESASIGKVIGDIPRELVRDIIVCNNNSTDATASVAAASGAIVVDQPLRGYGNACLAGMAYIKDRPLVEQPDIIVFMDGDYSDYPQEMKALLSPIKEGKDMVIGSRVKGNPDRGSLTIPQRFGNWLATRLIHMMYGFRFSDLGPFRAIRWQKLLSLDMQDKNYGWTVEMQVKALQHHLACAEVPVSYRKRIGTSKVSGTVKGSILAGYKILWTIFKSL
ncbi:MAG: glycosyltransferase family 2 protein [Saprospiraceae bacterium]|nr:glycosyltransferase family 2 protein [Candidatus Opimibacter skivensis]